MRRRRRRLEHFLTVQPLERLVQIELRHLQFVELDLNQIPLARGQLLLVLGEPDFFQFEVRKVVVQQIRSPIQITFFEAHQRFVGRHNRVQRRRLEDLELLDLHGFR